MLKVNVKRARRGLTFTCGGHKYHKPPDTKDGDVVVDVEEGDLTKVFLHYHNERVDEFENFGKIKQPNELGQLFSTYTGHQFIWLNLPGTLQEPNRLDYQTTGIHERKLLGAICWCPCTRSIEPEKGYGFVKTFSTSTSPSQHGP